MFCGDRNPSCICAFEITQHTIAIQLQVNIVMIICLGHEGKPGHLSKTVCEPCLAASCSMVCMGIVQR
jgi:hypothetical protein